MSVVKIVILNWNGAAHLRRFLPSVVRTASPGVEIVVADNGSTDGSAALVEREFPSVTLLRLPENYGFAGGYNRALERLGGDYWVLLNSDVEPAEGWLEPLIAELDALYTALKTGDTSGYLDEYRRRQVLTGQRVLVTPRRGTPRAAQVQGIDDECKLVVRFDGESRPAALNSGEVSVRLL